MRAETAPSSFLKDVMEMDEVMSAKLAHGLEGKDYFKSWVWWSQGFHLCYPSVWVHPRKMGRYKSCRRSWTWVQSPRQITNPRCSSAPISSVHKRLEHSTYPQSIGCMENEWILFAEGDGSWDKKALSSYRILFQFQVSVSLSLFWKDIPWGYHFLRVFFFFLITLTIVFYIQLQTSVELLCFPPERLLFGISHCGLSVYWLINQ